MLTIKKIEDIREAEAYLKAHGISHNIANEQAMGVYTQSGLIGLGSLCLCGYKVYLNFIHLAEEDAALSHGLAKSLLNMADLRGIKTVYGSNPALDKLYACLRFQKENEEYALSLENYFQAEHN
ncbi:MAG: hypothetical protein E7414_03965 [Ruminococcaceae bacterium]|nr:hypothetical protein [Oscillospiraceae bacterium]